MGPFFILLVYVSTAGEKLDFFSGAGAGDAFLTELGRRAGGDALLPLLSKGFSQNEEDNRLKSRQDKEGGQRPRRGTHHHNYSYTQQISRYRFILSQP